MSETKNKKDIEYLKNMVIGEEKVCGKLLFARVPNGWMVCRFDKYEMVHNGNIKKDPKEGTTIFVPENSIKD